MLVNITYIFLLHTPVDLPGGSITLGPAKSIIRIAGTASEFGYPEVYVSCRDLRKLAIISGLRFEYVEWFPDYTVHSTWCTLDLD